MISLYAGIYWASEFTFIFPIRVDFVSFDGFGDLCCHSARAAYTIGCYSRSNIV